MNRRYFHSSIHELETLFENSKDDRSVLEALEEELAYRKTERAAKLRRRVRMCLTELGVCTSELKQDALPFERVPSMKTDRIVEVWNDVSMVLQKSAAEPNLTSAMLRTRVKDHSQRVIPPETNAPESILSAWTALEVLSPPAFRRPEDFASGDRTRVAKLNGHQLPWERGEVSRPKQRLYYQIVLGAVRMEPAVELLIEHYGDTRIEKPGAIGNAALAVVIVDKQGCLVDSPAVAVSSFGWGVITALEGELEDLAQWANVESQLTARIEKILRNQTAEETDRTQPLTRAALMSAYEHLIATLGLPVEWIDPPEFAIRSYTYYKDPNPPEPILLNSFFLTDLAFAQELFHNQKAPRNLRRYLGLERPSETRDLIRDEAALEEAVSPQQTPQARWLGPGCPPLVLLLQAAVNIAFSETTASGLIGINGPPGTGKTTLLRDLVAGLVTERAQEMSTYADPETAFETTNLRLKVGQGWIHLYELDESLRGFEIVVASSNNKAVENISAELPGINAIADDASQLRYFQTVSDSLHQRETWGLIAAVLGNAQNRSRFKQLFWWDDDKGLSSYLRVVAGSLSMDENAKLPTILLAEDPPLTHAEALKRWQVARERFRKALKHSQNSQQQLENLRHDVVALQRLVKAEKEAARHYSEVVQHIKRLRQQHYDVKCDIKNACRQFGVDPDQYSAPLASVQTLGDAASAYTAEFSTRFGSRTVGVPLLVHRRCSEPMFSISNKIAYSGLMVPAKVENHSDVRGILGPSRWIDVEGSGEDKWCAQEGEEVVRLLRQLARACIAPDLYVITPFVIVADRLRWTIRETGVLRNWVDSEWQWLNERVGTVHTAQGREAEAVIIVLGAPNPSQTGARNWAGGRPNILNVAVTRAKEVVYVVGNRKLWRGAGVFAELDRHLPS